MASNVPIRGRGIAHRLQEFDPQAPARARAFYPAAWWEATGLGFFGVELYVTRGSVSVRLVHCRTDGREVDYAVLNATAGGSAFSPPIQTQGFDGCLLAVVDTATPDALFDLYFGTNEAPRHIDAKTAFAISGPTPVLLATREAFLRALSLFDGAAEMPGHLVLMPQDAEADAWAHLSPHPDVSLLPDRHSAGVGAMGRAIHALAYGNLNVLAATHLCLVEGATEAPTPGLFAHTIALARFLAVNVHISPTERHGFDWLLSDLRDIYRLGLPYPFLGAVAGQAYRAALAAQGGTCAQMPSLWAPAAPQAKAHLDHWIAAALRGQIPAKPAGDQKDWALFRRGPDAVIEAKLLAQNYPLPPNPNLMQRLDRKARQWRAKVGLLPPAIASDEALCARYQEAASALTTAPYWAQFADDTPPTRPILQRRAEREAALKAHIKETVAVQKQAQLLARAKAAFAAKLALLEQRLAAARLLDPERARADQDRTSRATLALLRGRHKGARAVIVGNGPSLQITDLARLKDAVTFASNKIYLAYPDTDWRPDYYSVEDHLVMLNNRAEIEALQGSLKLFPENLRDFGYHAPDTLFVPVLPANREAPLSDPDFPAFSDDLSQGIGWGSTIVYSQIQMAAYMGCAEIVLIGLDHSYILPDTKTGTTYHAAGEQNHFHPDYRALGELWHQPNLEVLEVSYARARDACAARGIKVLNASRQTALSVFERADFEGLFPATS